MEAQVDYYATLRVSPDADAASLRRAYRAQMRRYHPDVNKDADAGQRCHAINEAWECLGDPSKRADYDAMQRVARFRAPPDTPTQPRHRRAASPLHSFTPRYSARAGEELTLKSRWRKAAVIALGALVTLATFTATARVDWSPAPAAQAQEILLRAQVGGLDAGHQ